MDHSSEDESTFDHSYAVSVSRQRKIKNQLIAKMITGCGWLVLVTLAVLIWHLLSQVLPLLQTPQLQQLESYPWQHPDQQILLLGDLHNGGAVVSYSSDCKLHFYSSNRDPQNPQPAQLTRAKSVPTLCTEQVRAKAYGGEMYIARLDTSGLVRIERFSPLRESFVSQFEITLAVSRWTNQAVTDFNFELSPDLLMLSVQDRRGWRVISVDRTSQQEIHQSAPVKSGEPVLLPRIAQFLTTGEQTVHATQVRRKQTIDYPLPAELRLLKPFPGHRSLFVATAEQPVEKWSLANLNGQLRFTPVQQMADSGLVINSLVHHHENAALLINANNTVDVVNHVTGEVVSSAAMQLPMGQQAVQLSDQQLYFVDNQRIHRWQLDNLSAVNSIQSLWGKNTYAGYSEPEYVWQTTSAADFYERKHSIVPLIMGSLKASFLALLIAVPLAISAAVYTAYFAPQKLRNWMKPSIEVLEAIPSVVLGFIAAIWLAPLAEQFLLSVAVFVLLLPLSLVLFALLHQQLVERLPQGYKQGWELPVVAVLLVLNGLFVMQLTEPLSVAAVGSSDNTLLTFAWLENINKSTLVVALALGVAIVPSIYSLAEDAIFDVPTSLQQASLALGATRLQTLRKVVLVLAYPGILSAVTLGLGRAFGETMIVLMVTGNTPVAEWDLLAGVRTLTANLAIELPESEVGSSHYQILFLTALVLFSFTFVLNTLAELLRQWLRKNYRHG